MKKIGLIVMGLFLMLIVPFGVHASGTPTLSSLSVEGIGSLNVARSSFNVKLTSTLGYATITATPSDSSYVVTGAGQVKCNQGMNTINVVVKNPTDNSSKTYTINLNYVAGTSSSKTSIQNPNTSVSDNISLMVGIAIMGIVSLIFINRKLHKLVK
jgi:phosphotransferase system  glucose/maltose/N-acetylglucosamine-specific IIC component